MEKWEECRRRKEIENVENGWKKMGLAGGGSGSVCELN